MKRLTAFPALSTAFPTVVKAWDSTWFFLSTAVANLSNALMVSAIIHVVVIFGLTHQPVNPKLFDNAGPPIDVVLVNAKTKEKPLQADVLAQHNLDGGGNVDENRLAKSPLPASDRDQAMSAEAEFNARLQALEQQTQALMKQIKSDYKMPDQKPAAPVDARPPSPVPAPLDLASRSLEMARLKASIDQQREEYQKRPRRLFIGARAQEYTVAQYVEDWRIKVERVGNLNYPEAARKNRIYGSLMLEACIQADGALYKDPYEDNPKVVRSSGAKILDAAAVHIVEMSAPFGKFTEAVRQALSKSQTELLCITRTWSFTRTDQLTSQ